jgi:predicted transcriptional regulator
MEIVFTFHNTHGAIAGEQALMNGGLKVRVMALPSSLGAGCGLCLRVAEADLSRALDLLAGAGLEAQGLYRKIGVNGKFSYEAVGGAA